MIALPKLHNALKLLSDPLRLRLVALLSEEELAVHELVAVTGLSQSRVSNHLALLRRSGIVRDRREGTWSFYRLAEPNGEGPLSPGLFAAAVAPYLETAEGRADLQGIERVREQRRERSRRTHERLAGRWAEMGQSFRTGLLRAEMFGALVPPGLVVADLGCGAGYLSRRLAERGLRVIAVDHAPAMLEEARRLLPATVELRRGELDRLPLDDGEVDAALANLVWHHLPSTEGAARELARVVRPGGVAVVADLLPHEEEWMREDMGDLRLGLSPDEVAASLERAGFEDLAVEEVEDRYLVSGRSGREAAFPVFLVRGRRPDSGRPHDAKSV